MYWCDSAYWPPAVCFLSVLKENKVSSILDVFAVLCSMVLVFCFNKIDFAEIYIYIYIYIYTYIYMCQQ